MSERWRIASPAPKQSAKIALSQIAARQRGRVSLRQLRQLGVAHATISKWGRDGYLHRVHPGVYAVGHTATTIESDLAAALLYAGPGAMLSHATAAWWLQLTDRRPALIHVSTPRRCRSRRGLRIYQRRTCERGWHRGFPLTIVPQTLLDYAASHPFDDVRYVLAQADYRDLLDIRAVAGILGHGRRGSERLGRALGRHMPQLARTRSRLEVDWLVVCESAGIPLPEMNVFIEGYRVDALWRRERLVVELDGHQGHRSRAQLERDHRRALRLRAAGYQVVRYSHDLVTEEPRAVEADVCAALERQRAILGLPAESAA